MANKVTGSTGIIAGGSNVPSGTLPSQLIKEVALKALKELGVALALAALTLPFASPVSAPIILAAGIGVSVFNAVIRSVHSYSLYRDSQVSTTAPKRQSHTEPRNQTNSRRSKARLQKLRQESQESTQRDPKAIRCLIHIPSSVFGWYYQNTAGVLVHEGGHAAAAFLLYKDSHPTITLQPFDGGKIAGFTNWSRSKSNLRKLGQALGETNSRITVAAAGPGLSLISSLVAIGCAHYTSKARPEMARYLVVGAIMVLFSECAYALGSLSRDSSGGDFKRLWEIGGIHPLAALMFMVALPVGFKLFLNALDSSMKSSNNQSLNDGGGKKTSADSLERSMA